MKHLFLLRHGEAGFVDGSDFQRPLTQKGKENLNRLGQTLSESHVNADFLYCSAATRTRETAEIIKKYIEVGEEEYVKEIYDGNMESLLGLLENIPDDAESCIVIGHNPTISVLASFLTHSSYIGLQPGMMAIIDLEINDWSMIGVGPGILKELVK